MSQITLVLLLLEKIFAILGTILYFIFSIIIVKQVTSMSQNVYDKFNGILIVFSYLHLLFSLFLIALAILFL